MKTANHQINYIEFSVTNLEESKNFYTQALGWKFTDYAPDYAGIQSMDGKGEMGGLSVVEEVNTGGPLVVLYSTDLNASFEQVKAAGAKITKDIFEFPGGKRFEFQDPSGNALAIWSE